MSNTYPKKSIRIMLHALGIANVKNGDYTQPNKRYSPYPTSTRNYYSVPSCEHWDELVKKCFAKFVKRERDWMNYYYVTKDGKDYLRTIGYKWHEE